MDNYASARTDYTNPSGDRDMQRANISPSNSLHSDRECIPSPSLTRRQQILDLQIETARRAAQIETEIQNQLLQKELQLKVDAINMDERTHRLQSSRAQSLTNINKVAKLPASKYEPPTQICTSNDKSVEIPEIDEFLPRQTAKELSIYSGDPQEWPLFYSEYLSSTRLYGFSDNENIVRLDNSLRGQARDAVLALLANATNLNTIIDTLKRKFGRTEQIIDCMLTKIRSMREIRQDNLHDIIDVGTNVQNVITIMKTTVDDYYLHDPNMIKEIVAKLPIVLQLQWGFYVEQQHIRRISLETLSNWLMTVTDVVAHVPPRHDKPSERDDTDKSITPNDMVLATPSLKSACVICNENHKISNCLQFLSFTIFQRLKVVLRNRLCSSCLSAHHTFSKCNKKAGCPKRNCTQEHHPLLHAEIKHFKDKEQKFNNILCAHVRIVALKIVSVIVSGPRGDVKTLAVLDEGAALSLTDESLLNRIGVSGPKNKFQLRGATEDMETQSCESQTVDLKVKGFRQVNFFNLNNVRSLKNISLPRYKINFAILLLRYPFLSDFEDYFDDRLFGTRPLLLIGSDNLELIVTRKVYQGPKDGPIVSETYLGHAIHGKLYAGTPVNTPIINLCTCDEHDDI